MANFDYIERRKWLGQVTAGRSAMSDFVALQLSGPRRSSQGDLAATTRITAGLLLQPEAEGDLHHRRTCSRRVRCCGFRLGWLGHVLTREEEVPW